jgi:hypothetical protein
MPHHFTQRGNYRQKNYFRAGLTAQAGDWEWSSTRVHPGEIRPPGTMDLEGWSELYQPEQCRVVLEKSIHQEAWIRRLRYSSLRGYPLANEQFVEKLEQLSGKTLRPRPPTSSHWVPGTNWVGPAVGMTEERAGGAPPPPGFTLLANSSVRGRTETPRCGWRSTNRPPARGFCPSLPCRVPEPSGRRHPSLTTCRIA